MTRFATNDPVQPQARAMTRTGLERAPDGKAGRVVFILALLAYLYVLLRSAWICDDAYITFRTVSNFLGGYGLTWNTDERVQAYTHPLWMFVLSGVSGLAHNIYYSAMFTSMGLSAAAVLVLAFGLARTRGQAILGVTICVCSKALVDYSTSGLENPLSHLLVAWFLVLYLRPERQGTGEQQPQARAGVPRKTQFHEQDLHACRQRRRGTRLLPLSLLASLIALNRMDLMLLLGPALGHAFWQNRSAKAVGHIVLGFLPFLAWEVFSVIYYGFPFPNTAYAKPNTGISAATLLCHGLYYFANSLHFDPLTLPAITASLLAALLARQRKHLTLAAGIVLYLLYVLTIGGCFMSGRFFAVPLFAAAGLLAAAPPSRHAAVTAVAVPAAILLSLCSPRPIVLSDGSYDFDSRQSLDPREISDERAVYFQSTGLLRSSPCTDVPSKPAAQLGIAAARAHLRVLSSTTVIGMAGYYAGPKVHIVDVLALPDPLLARLPVRAGYFRIGHFERYVPDGYVEGLRSGRNELTDLRLREFYEKLRLIARGPIFRGARWRAILDMNLVRCRHLIDTEYYRHPPPRLHTGPYASENDRWTAQLNLRLSPEGAWIQLGQTCHARHIEIILDRSRDCRILYPQGPAEPVEQFIPADPAGSSTTTAQVPEAVSRTGFDRLLIRPAAGDDRCYVERVRLVDPEL